MALRPGHTIFYIHTCNHAYLFLHDFCRLAQSDESYNSYILILLLNISIKLVLPNDCLTGHIHCVAEALASYRVEHRYIWLHDSGFCYLILILFEMCTCNFY